MDAGTSLVVDIGSGSFKADLAGAEQPKTYANVYGKLKHKAVLPQQVPGMIDDAAFVGNDVAKHRGLLRLSYPMAHGHVTDWTHINHLYRHVLADLEIPPKDHPVLCSEAPHASRVQRNRLAQILLEEYQHPGVLFAVQGVLSLYSSGHTTGVVLDVGDGVTHACPVVEGYSVREAARRADFGGRDVTSFLQLLLRQNDVFLDTSAEFEIVKQIKEQRCEVQATTMRKEALDAGGGGTKTRHVLPDGSEISLGSELQLAPELFFQPSLFGLEHPSVVQVLQEAIRRTDIDLRAQLYESIHLVGGSTLCPKFAERFHAEVTRTSPRQCKVKMVAQADRGYQTWVGGSFLAQLSSFKQMVTRKQDYEEHGERILNARLFA